MIKAVNDFLFKILLITLKKLIIGDNLEILLSKMIMLKELPKNRYEIKRAVNV